MRRSPAGLQREAAARAAFCEFFGECSVYRSADSDAQNPDSACKMQAGNSRINLTYHVFTESSTSENSNSNQAVSAAIDVLLNLLCVGFLGPNSSGTSKAVSPLATIFGAPHISYAATSAELSDKSNYGYFFRTTPADNGQARAIAEFMQYTGWESFSIINTLDAYGSFGAKEVILSARSIGLSVAAHQEVLSGETSEDVLQEKLKKISSTRVRVVIIFMLDEDAVRVLRQAELLGMTGEEWTWLASDGLSGFDFIAGGLSEKTAKGFIGFNPFSTYTNSEYTSFQGRWNSTYNRPGGIITDYKNSSYTSLISAEINPVNYNNYGESFNSYAFYSYDAMLVLLTAIDDLAKEGINPCNRTLEDFRSGLAMKIRQTSLEGISGLVSFDENQDRDASEYDVKNYDGTTWRNFATWTSSTSFTFKNSFTSENTPVWSNGQIGIDAAPSGTVQNTLYEFQNYRGIFLAFTVLEIGLVLGLIVLTILLRNNGIIKAMSINMMQIINFGALLSLIGIILMYPEPTDSLCQASPVLLHIAYVLVYGTLFAKNNRIKHILVDSADFSENRSYSDIVYLKPVAAMMIIFTAYILAWYVTDPPKVATTGSSTVEFEDYQVCRSMNSWWFYSINIIEVLFLLVGIAVAWKVRNVTNVFNEAKAIAMSLYATVFVAVVLMGILIPIELNPDEFYAVFSMGLLVTTSTTLGLFYGPRLWAIHNKETVESYNAGSSHMSSKFRVTRQAKTPHQNKSVAKDDKKANNLRSPTARSSIGGGISPSPADSDRVLQDLLIVSHKMKVTEKEAEGLKSKLIDAENERKALKNKVKEMEELVVKLMDEKIMWETRAKRSSVSMSKSFTRGASSNDDRESKQTKFVK
mmetsp:Transcript_6169/g.9433  ORF Transcript_6169/g.9433 Transcript_6169/m.9433 type:complete len:866 (-) Transcript_6169:196-2793(-)